MNPFHLAILVSNLDEAREFYGGLLECREGRSADSWVDFDLFGHQLVCHLAPNAKRSSWRAQNPVDGDSVPVPHFGIVLEFSDWQQFAKRLEEKQIRFEIAPHVRFAGKAGEQGTLFFYDPFGNALEFKGFKDMSDLFATQRQ